MIYNLFELFSSLIMFVLHVTGAGSFPKALSASDEKKYLELMSKGDLNARQKLIEHNLRLVAHVIKKYYTPGSEQDDLISIGTIGLIKAIDSFKPDKGTRLSSYASRCVENEVLMHFRSLKKSSQDISLNEPIDSDKDGNALTIIDTMYHDDNIVDDIDLKIKSANLYKFIEKNLIGREKKILILRYGLYGQKPLTQREVAKHMKISRSYVSRLEKRAIDKLKVEFNNFDKFL